MYYIKAGNEIIYMPNFSTIGSPRLSRTVNKAGELTFTLYPESDGYNIRLLDTPVECYDDEESLFYGRALSYTCDSYGAKEVTCEGALSFLHDAPSFPFVFERESPDCVEIFLRWLLTTYNNYVDDWKKIYCGNVTVRKNSLTRYQTDYTLDMFDCLINRTVESELGGYLFIRRDDGKTYLDYLAEAPQNNEDISFGKNLVSVAREANASELFTIILPYGEKPEGEEEPVNITSVNNGSMYIENTDAIQQYGRIWKAVQYESITSPAELMKMAKASLLVGLLTDSITVTALDLSKINSEYNPIHCGDAIPIYSEPHGIDAVLVCTAETIYLDDPGATTYEFGTGATLTSQQVSANREISDTSDILSADNISLREELTEAQRIIGIIAENIQTGSFEFYVDAGETYEGFIIYESEFFYSVPTLQTKILPDTTDLALTITSESSTGFNFTLENTGEFDISGTLNWIART